MIEHIMCRLLDLNYIFQMEIPTAIYIVRYSP